MELSPTMTHEIGRVISRVRLDPDENDGDGELVFSFDDGSECALYDSESQCCEQRYMTCDDDLEAFAGARLLDVEVRYASRPQAEGAGRCDVHEEAFLVVTTSRGAFTVVTHNEHNGYYGGFEISHRIIQLAHNPNNKATKEAD